MINNFIKNFQRPYLGVILVFITSVLITILFSSLSPTSSSSGEQPDYTAFYKPVALNLIKGHGLIDSQGKPGIRYPPGYPIILAGVLSLSAALQVSEGTALLVFIVCCFSLASVFIFLISKIFWRPGTAIISALGFMTYPFSLWLTKQPNVEIPFLVTFYASLLFLTRAIIHNVNNNSSAFFSGLLIGISMLIRPIAIGLPFVMGLLLWIFAYGKSMYQRFILIMLMLFGVILIVAPWEAWLYSHTGNILLLSSGGTPSILDGLTFGINSKGYRHGIQVPEDVKALMYHFQLLRFKLVSLGSILQSLIEQMSEQPMALLNLFLIKAGRSWFGTDSQRFEMPILFIQISYVGIFLWATIKCCLQSTFLRWLSVSIWLFVVYFWLMTITVLPILRYMVPGIGILFILLPAAINIKSANEIITEDEANNDYFSSPISPSE